MQYQNFKNEIGGKQKVPGRMKCLTPTSHIQFTVKKLRSFHAKSFKTTRNAIPI